jgi:signal transduction histidine kinase
VRTLLRAGFGAVILFTIGSTIFAYRFLTYTDEDTLSARQRYQREEQAIEEVRKHLARLANNARDFFQDSRPNSAAVYHERFEHHKAETLDLLAELGKLTLTGLPLHPLAERMNEYFEVMSIPRAWTAGIRAKREYEFFEQQVAPRRAAARKSIDALVTADREAREAILAKTARARMIALRNMFSMVILTVFCAFGVAGFSLGHAADLERAGARKYEEVICARNELEQLSARLMRVQEEERRNLSRELHDGIGQTLTALRIEISYAESRGALADAESRERLQRARALADDAARTTRDITLLLRPPLLDELGLEPALRWQTEKFTARNGIPCDFSAIGVQDHPAEAWKTCVYRVVQEALHNSQKHAAPKRVRVLAQQEVGLLSVEVEDDGCGFELNEKGAPARTVGLGILGMRERAAMLGGELSIQSSPGRGTRVTLRLPLATLLASADEPAAGLKHRA